MSMNIIANIVILKVLAFKFFGQYHGSGSIRTFESLYRFYYNG